MKLQIRRPVGDKHPRPFLEHYLSLELGKSKGPVSGQGLNCVDDYNEPISGSAPDRLLLEQVL